MTNKPNCHRTLTLFPGPRGFGTICWYGDLIKQRTRAAAGCFMCCQIPVSGMPLPPFSRFAPTSLPISCAAASCRLLTVSQIFYVQPQVYLGCVTCPSLCRSPRIASAICPWWFSFRLGPSHPFHILLLTESCYLFWTHRKKCLHTLCLLRLSSSWS